MIRIAKLSVVVVFLLTLLTQSAFAASFPPRYEGALNVCGKVSSAMREGKSLESALLDLLLFYSDQPVQVYRSIQRGLIYAAIQDCHYDGGDVIRAALRVDMNLPLLIVSMSEAGVTSQTLRDALLQAGLNRPAIDEAFEMARLESQAPSPDYVRDLSLPFEVTGGLGQASPFIP